MRRWLDTSAHLERDCSRAAHEASHGVKARVSLFGSPNAGKSSL